MEGEHYRKLKSCLARSWRSMSCKHLSSKIPVPILALSRGSILWGLRSRGCLRRFRQVLECIRCRCSGSLPPCLECVSLCPPKFSEGCWHHTAAQSLSLQEIQTTAIQNIPATLSEAAALHSSGRQHHKHTQMLGQ